MGSSKGKTYPDGPWGPESHIQRGGIVYDFRVPGDPLTPGWASVPGAKRIRRRRRRVAAEDHQRAALVAGRAGDPRRAARDPRRRRSGRAGCRSHTASAAAPATVRMRVQMDNKVRPIWTVTGRITGSASPDDLVIVGNHRDAWVYGGVDPSSGTASLMELARSLGALAKQGDAPEADDRVRELGRRGVHAHLVDRVGRAARARARRARGRLSERRQLGVGSGFQGGRRCRRSTA